MCWNLTDSILVHCLVGTEMYVCVQEDFEQMGLNESWHLGAEVANSNEVVL